MWVRICLFFSSPTTIRSVWGWPRNATLMKQDEVSLPCSPLLSIKTHEPGHHKSHYPARLGQRFWVSVCRLVHRRLCGWILIETERLYVLYKICSPPTLNSSLFQKTVYVVKTFRFDALNSGNQSTQSVFRPHKKSKLSGWLAGW